MRKILKKLSFIILLFITTIICLFGILSIPSTIKKINYHKDIKDSYIVQNGIYIQQEIDTSIVQNSINKLPTQCQKFTSYWSIIFLETIDSIHLKYYPFLQNLFLDKSAFGFVDNKCKTILIFNNGITEDQILHLFYTAISYQLGDLGQDKRISSVNTNELTAFESSSNSMIAGYVLKEYFHNQQFYKDNYELFSMIEEITNKNNLQLFFYSCKLRLNSCFNFIYNCMIIKRNDGVFVKNSSDNALNISPLISNFIFAVNNIENIPNSEYMYVKNGQLHLKSECTNIHDTHTQFSFFCRNYLLNQSIKISRVKNNNPNEIILLININDLKNAISEKQKLDIKALNVIKQMDDENIVNSIACFIINNMQYNENKNSISSFWNDYSGKCLVFAFTFKQFLDLIGVENDIVFGYTKQSGTNNFKHAWNRIKLTDGTYRYYDLTFAQKDMSYLNRTQPIHIQTQFS